MRMSWINICCLLYDMPYVEIDTNKTPHSEKSNNTTIPETQHDELEAMQGFF